MLHNEPTGSVINHTTVDSSAVIRTSAQPSGPMQIGMVDYDGKNKLRKCGSGKITIDSGVGESVCLVDMVPDEPIHKTDKIGTRYRVAGGQTLINKVEKRVKF